MKTEIFERTTHVDATPGELFAWHTRPGAFERLTPPWEPVEVVERTGSIKDGDRLVMQVGPLKQRWVAEHTDYIEGEQFVDVQLEGPMAYWRHTHRCEADDDGALLRDRIEYALPMGVFGRVFGSRFMRRKLERMFAYRQRVTAGDVASHAQAEGSKTIMVTGASGMVGSALVPFLTTGGHRVVRAVRNLTSPASPGEISWTQSSGYLEGEALDELDAVIHLASEPIDTGRWSELKKERIRGSRAYTTWNLAKALARLDRPPRVLIAASACGFYGGAGGPFTEDDAPGAGFLAEVCSSWEDALEPAREAGIRVVPLRFAFILGYTGGALAKIVPIFKLGLAGKVGGGRQTVNWISLEDAVGVIYHAMIRDEITGPVNAVSPNPVSNATFAHTLGRVLNRPALFTLPAGAARAVFGEKAEELLLSGGHVEPRRLMDTGYTFRFPELEGALRHVLGRYEAATSGDPAP